MFFCLHCFPYPVSRRLVTYSILVSSCYQSLERILYVWAIRHPASGYVQGINDLVTPFFQIFLSAYIGLLLHIASLLNLTSRLPIILYRFGSRGVRSFSTSPDSTQCH